MPAASAPDTQAAGPSGGNQTAPTPAGSTAQMPSAPPRAGAGYRDQLALQSLLRSAAVLALLLGLMSLGGALSLQAMARRR